MSPLPCMHGGNIDVITRPGAMARTPAMKPTTDDVEAFLDAFPSETGRADAHQLSTLMAEVTGEPPMLWGSSRH